MIVDFIKQKFKKEVAKYEFHLLEGNESMIKRDMEIYQKKGWELAGECATKFSHDGYRNRILVPLKRKIK